MNSQKKMTKSSNTNNNSNSTSTVSNNNNNNNGTNNFTRKPRRSIKAEGNCLNGMLREGSAHVIDASKLGKRLSSEIWNSFGAIQVQDNFTYPSIDTKTVADGSSTVKICQFFVACSKCFSVFKYDGHAYGTTGLVKHVKICQGTNQSGIGTHPTTTTTTNSGYNTTTNLLQQPKLHHTTIDNNTHTSSSTSVLNVQLNNNTPTITTNTSQQPISGITIANGPVATIQKRKSTPRAARAPQPNLKLLVKAIDELRSEQNELKQKIHEMINMMNGSGYVGQIQIISNDGDKVEDELQPKTE